MTMNLQWPASLADGDALIVREETPSGLRFVVHSRREPQFMCTSYMEAENRTLAYARHARVSAWYWNGRGRLQLLAQKPRPSVAPRRRKARIAPALEGLPR